MTFYLLSIYHVSIFLSSPQRASQIRSMPFTGDSSDDSSDGEGEHTHYSHHSTETRITNSSSDNTGENCTAQVTFSLLFFSLTCNPSQVSQVKIKASVALNFTSDHLQFPKIILRFFCHRQIMNDFRGTYRRAKCETTYPHCSVPKFLPLLFSQKNKPTFQEFYTEYSTKRQAYENTIESHEKKHCYFFSVIFYGGIF